MTSSRENKPISDAVTPDIPFTERKAVVVKHLLEMKSFFCPDIRYNKHFEPWLEHGGIYRNEFEDLEAELVQIIMKHDVAIEYKAAIANLEKSDTDGFEKLFDLCPALFQFFENQLVNSDSVIKKIYEALWGKIKFSSEDLSEKILAMKRLIFSSPLTKDEKRQLLEKWKMRTSSDVLLQEIEIFESTLQVMVQSRNATTEYEKAVQDLHQGNTKLLEKFFDQQKEIRKFVDDKLSNYYGKFVDIRWEACGRSDRLMRNLFGMKFILHALLVKEDKTILAARFSQEDNSVDDFYQFEKEFAEVLQKQGAAEEYRNALQELLKDDKSLMLRFVAKYPVIEDFLSEKLDKDYKLVESSKKTEEEKSRLLTKIEEMKKLFVFSSQLEMDSFRVRLDSPEVLLFKEEYVRFNQKLAEILNQQNATEAYKLAVRGKPALTSDKYVGGLVHGDTNNLMSLFEKYPLVYAFFREELNRKDSKLTEMNLVCWGPPKKELTRWEKRIHDDGLVEKANQEFKESFKLVEPALKEKQNHSEVNVTIGVELVKRSGEKTRITDQDHTAFILGKLKGSERSRVELPITKISDLEEMVAKGKENAADSKPNVTASSSADSAPSTEMRL